MPCPLNLFSLITAFLALAAAIAVPPSSHSSPDPRALAKRILQKRYNTHTLTSISCGGYSTADTVDTGKNINNLNNGDEKTVAAGTCNRIGCYNTSGVYVCNDNDFDITFTGADGSAFAGLILGVCYDGGEGHHPVSGQAFTSDNDGFNVVVGFCDNDDDVATKPSDYTPPGPNGNAPINCGGNSDTTCSLGSCSSNLAVATQENTPCDEYLGPNTIGPGAQYTYSTTRTIGTTWTVGFDLGIDSSELATVAGSAGFSASFSKTTLVGDSSGVSQSCGSTDATGNFTCDLIVAPGCYHMTGTCMTEISSTYSILVPFDTTQPQADAEDGQGVWSSQICTCQNCCDWANAAAPPFACPQDCATCKPLEDGCPA
ncbi:uncharacterized protein LTR77_010718 [Saxophila tyrrhenica]|uniref:Uncharacterized protein n=1 Tax=Saxophila tyrrhenica TaxID=1690608 RepID=A0AAV9NVF9_9PEZI|nr:hypothetical protein LTR77_010718 [Saxophila tyrrhenica]